MFPALVCLGSLQKNDLLIHTSYTLIDIHFYQMGFNLNVFQFGSFVLFSELDTVLCCFLVEIDLPSVGLVGSSADYYYLLYLNFADKSWYVL